MAGLVYLCVWFPRAGGGGGGGTTAVSSEPIRPSPPAMVSSGTTRQWFPASRSGSAKLRPGPEYLIRLLGGTSQETHVSIVPFVRSFMYTVYSDCCMFKLVVIKHMYLYGYMVTCHGKIRFLYSTDISNTKLSEAMTKEDVYSMANGALYAGTLAVQSKSSSPRKAQ